MTASQVSATSRRMYRSRVRNAVPLFTRGARFVSAAVGRAEWSRLRRTYFAYPLRGRFMEFFVSTASAVPSAHRLRHRGRLRQRRSVRPPPRTSMPASAAASPKLVKRGDLRGKTGDAVLLADPSGAPVERVIVLGLGNRSAFKRKAISLGARQRADPVAPRPARATRSAISAWTKSSRTPMRIRKLARRSKRSRPRQYAFRITRPTTSARSRR